MRSSILVLLTAAATAMAVPTGWSAPAAKYYARVSHEIRNLQNQDTPPAPSCDLSTMVLPHTSEPLPDVPKGQKLLAVGIGRGTQNYTCESSSSVAEPEATGALATVFNASCIGANYPYLLSLLPNMALGLSQPPPFTDAVGPAEIGLLGHHFFDSEGAAIFDIKDFGASAVSKKGSASAPANALEGVGKQKNGAVPWLFLDGLESNTGKVKSVYRVNTAGGKPPANCAGQPAEMAIQYAAEYWFYG